MIVGKLRACFKNLNAIIFIILVLSGDVAAQNFGIHFTGNQKKVVVPFETYNNLIVFSITLNGTIPLKFILDTGVRSTILLDRNITDVLGVKYSRKMTLFGVGNNQSVEAYVANNLRISMPGITSGPISMLVLEKDYLNLRNHLGTDIHGIMGYDLFSRFAIKIDYQRELLVFYRPQKFKPPRKYQEFGLTVSDTKPFIEIPLQMDDSTSLSGKLMIDTGASHALILHAGSDDQIRIPPRRIKTKLGRGLAGDVEGYLGRIVACRFGKYILRRIITSFPDDLAYSDSLYVAERNGTIGGEILSKFTVIVDYIHQKMYLKKNSNFKAPFEYNMSGIEVAAKGSDLDTYYVDLVRQGSVADLAGVKAGDKIIQIDGIPSERLTFNHIYKIFDAYPDKKIRIRLERAKKMYNVELRLKQEI